MTRRRDLMCEDIFGCTHEPETPVADQSGGVAYWVCRCGKKQTPAEAIRSENTPKETDDDG